MSTLPLCFWHVFTLLTSTGIYDKEEKCVIQFGDSTHCVAPPDKHISLPWSSPKEVLEAAKTYIDDVVHKSIDVGVGVVGKAVMLGCRTEVFCSTLDYFQCKDKSVLVWQYPSLPEEGTAPDSVPQNRHYARNGADAVLLAYWFAKYPEAFGAYHLGEWNCEHFSSFCKTTSLTTVQLDEYRKSGDGVVPRDQLLEHSKARSIQMEKLRRDWNVFQCEPSNPNTSSSMPFGLECDDYRGT